LHDRQGQGIFSNKSGVRGLAGANLNDTATHTGQITGSPTLADFTNVNLPAAAINGVAPGVASFVLYNSAMTRFLNLELSALQADAKGKVVSSPRVITADKVEAVIEQGTEIPYQEASSSGATSVSFKKAVLSLKVTPQITPDDNVIMNVAVHKDSRGQDTISGPAIDTKSVTTQVLVENGGTVVIGGIYEQQESNQTTKIPVLGDLPYVGFLFKQNQKFDNKSELLVFITPRILKDSLNVR
jgi:type IV pilus assembly protein PilQ